MRTLALVMVLSTLGCDDGAPFGDDGTPCPSAETAGGWFPVNDGTAGVYHVEIAQGDVHLMAGFPHEFTLWTPSWPIGAPIAGCPQLYNSRSGNAAHGDGSAAWWFTNPRSEH